MRSPHKKLLVLAVASLLAAAGCAGRSYTLELSGTIIHDKPRIRSFSYELADLRGEGGALSVSAELRGDQGLEATFDITPDIADHQPMREVEAGVYRGEFAFPPGVTGGPFTVTGRLEHEQAGQVILRDPRLLTIPILDRQ